MPSKHTQRKFPSTGPAGGQTSRFKVRGREVEHRRLRGEASCAECRRCKLKCDKKIPCGSCVRRGCHTICPNGSLASASGRVILSSSDTLHRKLLEMSQRIRQLEDAVQIIQSLQSNSPHPLLEDRYLTIKSFEDVEEPDPGPEAERVTGVNGAGGGGTSGDDGEEEGRGEGNAVLTDALGTLAITDKGEVRFMGRVSTEALLMSTNKVMNVHAGADYSEEGAEPGLLVLTTADATAISHVPERTRTPSAGDADEDGNIEDEDNINKKWSSFEFKPGAAHEGLSRAGVLRGIIACVPPPARVKVLVEKYLEHVRWTSRLVEREQIEEEILPIIYRRTDNAGQVNEGDCTDVRFVHRLALFFAVIACGASIDLSVPAHNAEAKRYDALSRTCVSVCSVFAGTSLESVQTLVLLAHYQFFSSASCSFEPAWKTLIFALTLGLSIGLHRDPSRWEMEPKLRERRRLVFWELFVTDKWKCLESGRPSIFNISETDCEYPVDDESSVGPDGTFRPSYWRWKFTFAKEVVGPIAEFMALAKPVKYSEVLELDRKMREFNSRPAPAEVISDDGASSIIRRSLIGIYRELAQLYLHRNFFARAMLEDPEKALSGPYSASVFATYACSIALLKLVRAQYEVQSPMLVRQWFLWIHSLIAAVVVGTVAVKGSTLVAARAAHSELESAVELFEEAHRHPICKSGLKILHRLLDKSRHRIQSMTADARTSTSGVNAGSPTSPPQAPIIGIADEELQILGGAARTLNFTTKSATNGTSAHNTATSPTRARNGLFAVDSSNQSVFCPAAGPRQPVNEGVLDAPPYGPIHFMQAIDANPSVEGSRGRGNGKNTSHRNDHRSNRSNVRGDSFDSAQGAGRYWPYARPNQAGAEVNNHNQQDMPQSIPPFSAQSDALSTFQSFGGNAIPNEIQSLFINNELGSALDLGTVANPNADVAATGEHSADADLFAEIGLNITALTNFGLLDPNTETRTSFDVLMDDMLSAAPAGFDNFTNINGMSTVNAGGAMNGNDALGETGGAVRVSQEHTHADEEAWQAFFSQMQALEESGRTAVEGSALT